MTNHTNNKLAFASAMATFAAFTHADVRVGAWERGSVTNVTAVTESATVAVAPEGSFDKAGAGDYTLGLSKIVQPNAFELGVRAGQATLDLTTEVQDVAAPSVLNRAFVWIDAERNTSPAAGGTGLSAWNDSREASAAGPYVHYGMVAAGTAPVLVDRHARKMVYFNGAYSGAFLQLETPSRPGTPTQLSDVGTKIKHVFFVADFDSVYSFLMGGYGCHDMMIGSGGTSTSLDQTYISTTASNTTAPYDARTYLDGERIDGTATKVKKGLQVLEFEFCGKSPRFSYVFNDNDSCKGGDYIGEVLLFTNALTSAERLDVNAYLAKKWKGTVRPSGVSLAVADGATGAVSVPSGATASVGAAGKGRIVKSGAGTLVVSNAVAEALRGEFAVSAGTLTAAARSVPYALSSGERVTATTTSADETKVTSAAPLAAGTAEKAGNGTLVVRTLDASVSNLTVAAGTLTLAGADREPDAVVAGTGVAVTIPNAGFEEFPASSGDKQFGKNETYLGWTGENLYVRYARPSLMVDWMKSNNYAPYGAAEGSVIMILENGGCAHTTISVPEDGDYELTFQTTTRSIYDYSTEGGALDVELIRDGVTNQVAHFQSFLGTGFHLHRYLVRDVKAGAYVFRFANNQAGVSGAAGNTNVDDIRMVRVTRSDGRIAHPVPNGDFEQTDFTYSQSTKFTSAVVSKGWTFTQGGGHTDENPDVGAVLWRSSRLYNHASSRYGNVQLFFASNGGTATTAAFTPPAGTWKVRCRGGRWGFSDGFSWQGNSLTANPTAVASVSVGGQTATSLGSVAAANNAFKTIEFPIAFTVDGATAVSVTLSQSVANAGLLIDDLELVAAGPEELVANGGFESKAGWTFTMNQGHSQQYHYGWSPSTFGTTRYEGDYYLMLNKNGVGSRTVTFPAAGVYRLSFHAAGRADNAAYRGNQVRAWLNDGQSERVILTTPTIQSSEFREYACLFAVPAAGDYTLGLTTCSTADKTVRVDGVSIRAAATEDVPSVSAATSLSVSSGAQLRLDFSGTLPLREFRVNGRRAFGTIDASRFPDSLSGTGSLYVEPKGTAILVR